MQRFILRAEGRNKRFEQIRVLLMQPAVFLAEITPELGVTNGRCSIGCNNTGRNLKAASTYQRKVTTSGTCCAIDDLKPIFCWQAKQCLLDLEVMGLRPRSRQWHMLIILFQLLVASIKRCFNAFQQALQTVPG
ncbi:hypothetical protein ISO4_03068 [Alcanivorax venustensis ISO4]|uniref:Transposase n=1 Tax=Alloalcanivorax venustensis ISO4 TaxID=1177184 RepID=A0ABS0AJZ4_9GAMM|nr:hypothetical protein [Alloalcanivorax venustensis ISO4]